MVSGFLHHTCITESKGRHMINHPTYSIVLLVTLLLLYISFRWSFIKSWLGRRQSQCQSTTTGYPTHKPICPACQTEALAIGPPGPPRICYQDQGRPRSVDTSNHYCPNPNCLYYGWVGRGNIRSNGHPNGGRWRQLQCIVCETYFMETQGTIPRFHEDRLLSQSYAIRGCLARSDSTC